MSNVTVVTGKGFIVKTRKDIEDALDRLERNEGLPEDVVMIRAIVKAYYALIEDECDAYGD